MCGRFEYCPEEDAIIRVNDEALLEPVSFQAKRGEIFPTDDALVLTSENHQLVPRCMKWGFPGFQGKSAIFNARAETALQKPFFRQALLTQRVVVPTTGFYEWAITEPGQKKKSKYRFFEAGSPFTWLAGFSQERNGAAYFTILTTEANDRMAAYHSRMPVLLHEAERLEWLEGEHWQHYLRRVPFALETQWIT